MARLGIEENQIRLSSKVKFSLCLTNRALCNQGVYIHVFLTRALHTLVSIEEAGWAPEPVLIWRSEKFLTLLGLKIQPQSPSP
jgi:hypothetical protein